MSKSFIIWFGICFTCYFHRTLFNILNYHNYKFVKSKYVLSSVYIVMFILWFSWGQMCFVDPVKISLPLWFRYFGLLLFVTGIFLFIFSHIKLKGFKNKGTVVKKGIYSKIRNPMYLGFIIWIIGFPIFMQKLLALLSSIIWITYIMIWKIMEEKELERKYPDYKNYIKETWF
jgi:protein-S-isoprenylcysteine O-methyltransferase Ste14